MPLLTQSKMLRVLESREVERVGGTKPVRVDVRVIAATNRNLESMVMDGLFRQDLYYRLHVVAIEVPPLRECAGDIPLLVGHMIDKLHRERGLPRKEVDEAATAHLQSYHWPGNTRELGNLLEHLMNTVDGAVIGAGDLPPQFTGYKVRPNTSLTENLGGLEKELVSQAMGRAKGNKKKAARLLGIHRSTLYDKLKKLGMADQE